METFADKLTALRKSRKLSQEKLSEELGVSRQTIYNWETGQMQPKAENIKSICDYFGIAVSDFYDDESDGIEQTCAAAVQEAVGRSLSRIFMPLFSVLFAVAFVVTLVLAVRGGFVVFSDNHADRTVLTTDTSAATFIIYIIACVASAVLFAVCFVKAKKAFAKNNRNL